MQNQRVNKSDIGYTGQTVDIGLEASNPTQKGIIYKENYVAFLGYPFEISSKGLIEEYEEPDEEILREIENKNYKSVLSPIV